MENTSNYALALSTAAAEDVGFLEEFADMLEMDVSVLLGGSLLVCKFAATADQVAEVRCFLSAPNDPEFPGAIDHTLFVLP